MSSISILNSQSSSSCVLINGFTTSTTVSKNGISNHQQMCTRAVTAIRIPGIDDPYQKLSVPKMICRFFLFPEVPIFLFHQVPRTSSMPPTPCLYLSTVINISIVEVKYKRHNNCSL
ncbi:hypothetical protein M9H77_12836 [Catharanthus roseus]|uniref:Uncharacterized protein n=1 Tax=Catharanthus roseus TaxID=4058 RepID=A0ACC0BIJ3_CATRO|nr:hypothetical protein M9H77_12836 [Catharanthus roseus]